MTTIPAGAQQELAEDLRALSLNEEWDIGRVVVLRDKDGWRLKWKEDSDDQFGDPFADPMEVAGEIIFSRLNRRREISQAETPPPPPAAPSSPPPRRERPSDPPSAHRGVGDSPRYPRMRGERLRWIKEAIAKTRSWIREAGSSALAEKTFSRPGEFDYDAATDVSLAIRSAAVTLTALEAEEQSLLRDPPPELQAGPKDRPERGEKRDEPAPARQETPNSDPAMYVGYNGQRLLWVEQAITTTQSWFGEFDGAYFEIAFSGAGDFGGDVSTNDLSVRRGAVTLTALKAEQAKLVLMQRALQRDADAGTYDRDRS
jgi:hypothetical protein